MSKTDTKNKPLQFGDLVADSEPRTKEIALGDNVVIVRELNGRERFEASTKAEDENQWETMLWLVNLGIVAPKPASMEELEKIKPEWVQKLSAGIMELSGMSLDETEDAEKESAAVIDIGGS